MFILVNNLIKMDNSNILSSKRINTMVMVVLGVLALFLVVKSVVEFKQIGVRDVTQSMITVQGKGEQFVIPDVAVFTFQVLEEGKDVSVAQAKATEKNNTAISYLKEKGIEAKDIKTVGYNADPKYNYNQSNPVLVGYTVSQVISVKVRNVEKAGDILAGIGSLGVSNISGLTFTTDDDTVIKAKARALAISNAQENAERLAKELGVKLDGVAGFYEDTNPSPYYGREDMYAGAMMDKKVAVPQIELGQNKVTVNVNVTYRIK